MIGLFVPLAVMLAIYVVLELAIEPLLAFMWDILTP